MLASLKTLFARKPYLRFLPLALALFWVGLVALSWFSSLGPGLFLFGGAIVVLPICNLLAVLFSGKKAWLLAGAASGFLHLSIGYFLIRPMRMSSDFLMRPKELIGIVYLALILGTVVATLVGWAARRWRDKKDA